MTCGHASHAYDIYAERHECCGSRRCGCPCACAEVEICDAAWRAIHSKNPEAVEVVRRRVWAKVAPILEAEPLPLPIHVTYTRRPQ